MRTRLIAVCSTLALAPLAQAQEGQPDQGAQTQPEAPAQEQAPAQQAPAQPTPAQPAPEGQTMEAPQGQTGQVKVPNVPGAKEEAPGQTHTVVKGDTLWDLSSTYLGSPWYWPKVWSYNPQIANPHWIYPGNQIRFFRAGEQGPAQVEVATPQGEVGGGDEAPSDQALEGEEEAAAGVQVAGRIGYIAPKTLQIAHQGFVTPQQVESSGTLAHAPTEALMLSYPDKIYLSFKKLSDVKVGDNYVIFRTTEKIKHPVTGADFGYLTDIVGSVRITSTTDKYAVGQILGSNDEIRRGDLVGPYGEALSGSVAAKPNDKSLDGTVLSMLVPYLTLAGEQTKILIDKGSADGVAVGNTFTIVRQADPQNELTDPSRNQDMSLPVEAVGECVAVDVKERATTCLLTRSVVEIVPGDRAWMRPDGTRVGLR
jgi:LysM repeat protein